MKPTFSEKVFCAAPGFGLLALAIFILAGRVHFAE